MTVPDRAAVTQRILAARAEKGLSWAEIAGAVGRSREWVVAGCLGQMALRRDQAETLVELLGLPAEVAGPLTVPPYRGSLPSTPPTDPLVYRFHELVSVYGTTLKELIAEDFGDGIMSAIDFTMRVEREPDPNGDRVRITMSGKFLPYREY